jgi:hypothetical protein
MDADGPIRVHLNFGANENAGLFSAVPSEANTRSEIELRFVITGTIKFWTTISAYLTMLFVKQDRLNVEKERLNTWPTIFCSAESPRTGD